MNEEILRRFNNDPVYNIKASAEIQQHVDEFLRGGGKIDVVSSSARTDNYVMVGTSLSTVKEITCKNCGKKFRAPKSAGAPRKFCKKACRLAARVR